MIAHQLVGQGGAYADALWRGSRCPVEGQCVEETGQSYGGNGRVGMESEERGVSSEWQSPLLTTPKWGREGQGREGPCHSAQCPCWEWMKGMCSF